MCTRTWAGFLTDSWSLSGSVWVCGCLRVKGGLRAEAFVSVCAGVRHSPLYNSLSMEASDPQ